MTDTRKLDVYLRENYAGILEQDSQANLTFSYDEGHLAEAANDQGTKTSFDQDR